MSTNAHFIHAVKLLTPGASYSADLVLPRISDLAQILHRVDVNPVGEVFVRCGGSDSCGEHVEFPAIVSVEAPAPTGVGPHPPVSAVDGAAIIALLMDEAVAEFGVEPVVAAAWETAGRRMAVADAGLILSTLTGSTRTIDIRLKTPTERLRMRSDGSMAISLRISR